MRTISRALVAAIAVSFLAAPMANAQPRHDERSHSHHQVQPKKPSFHKNHAIQKHQAARHHWSKGQRYGDWKRHGAVRDYHHHGLKRPGHGQQWVKVDNQYLLISLATGLIAGIAAAR